MLLDAALEVRGGVDTRGGDSPLRSMEVARPAVRTVDPVDELGDRLVRLHRVGWQLTRETYVGICTLGDFPVAAVMVHEHAGRLLRHASGPEPALDAGSLAHLREVRAAWRLIHLHTRQLRTATPPMMAVRGDVLAIRHLLNFVGTQAAGEHPHAFERRLESAIFGGARAFRDVARWNSVVLDHLDRNGWLYVPGRLLSGDEVSDHPALVEAKLAGRVTTATKERMEPLRTAYQAAQCTATLSAWRTVPAPRGPWIGAQSPSAQ